MATLWLCLYLPDWPLQVASRALEWPAPLVLQRRGRVSHANPPAREAGIRPGMKVGTARALRADLHTMARDKPRERAAMERLAAWAYRYSDRVLPAVDALLLEIGGSLKLWGPLPKLTRRLDEGLVRLGYQGRAGVAPTAACAQLFAPHGLIAVDRRHMRQLLRPLPLAGAPLDAEVRAALRRTGIRCFRELLGLPRSGLRSRFGRGLDDYLAQLDGLRPDPRPRYAPPPRFHGDLALPAPIHAGEGLLFAGRRLLEELCACLEGQDAAAQQLHWRLSHEGRPESRFTIGLASPGRSTGRWLAVLREHLAEWRLPAPVVHLRLDATQLFVHRPRQRDLLDNRDRQENREQVLERLQARLGERSVTGVAMVADHRPEKAWRYGLDGAPVLPDRPRRPLWLLPRPEPVDPVELHFLTRAERIETGWWDDAGYTRDYYVADHPDGRRVWVFQERKPAEGWFVHGIFG